MTKRFSLAIVSALFFACPASAQTFFPHLAAKSYCDLRLTGVARSDAMRIAITDNWSTEAPKYVDHHGKQTDSNVVKMAISISKNCPKYLAD